MTQFWIVMHPVIVVVMYLVGAGALGITVAEIAVRFDRILNALERRYPNDQPRPVRIRRRRRPGGALLPMKPERSGFRFWRRA